MSASSSVADSSPVAALVLRHAEARPDHPALLYPAGGRDRGYETVTYAGLAERVTRAAAALQSSGVGRGDRVVVLVPMSRDLYVVLLAIVCIGAVAVFVEPASTAREIARVCRVTRPKAFVGIPRAHALRAVFRDVARIPVQVLVGEGPLSRAFGAMRLADMERSAAGAALPAIAVRKEDPALLTFSSGSTGTTKRNAAS